MRLNSDNLLYVLLVCLINATSVLIRSSHSIKLHPNCRNNYVNYHRNHTACRNTNKQCRIVVSGVRGNEMNAIVSLHNDLRNRIAAGNETGHGFPASSNMRRLEWSPELARIAQNHADQCHFGHDCYACRRSQEFEYVGQNLFLLRTSLLKLEPNWDLVVKTWYDELQIAPKSVVEFFDSHGQNIGHFTQMAWASTLKIGCGFVVHLLDHSSRSPYKIAQLYTCNYGPAGNYVGVEMYQKGRPASRCPAGWWPSHRYPALCEERPTRRFKSRVNDVSGVERRLKSGIKRRRVITTSRRQSKVIIRKFRRTTANDLNVIP